MTLEPRKFGETNSRRFADLRAAAKKFDEFRRQSSTLIAKSYFDQLDRSQRQFPNVGKAPRSSNPSRFYSNKICFQNQNKRSHALEQKSVYLNFKSSVYDTEKLKLAISAREWHENKLSLIDRSFEGVLYVTAGSSFYKNNNRKSTDAEILPFILLERAKALLSNQNILEAKRILREGIYWFPDDKRIANLMDTISPMQKTKMVKASGKRRENELSWIKDNFNEYRGKWVAVDEKGLVASADKLKDLLRNLKKMARGDETPLIQYIASELE